MAFWCPVCRAYDKDMNRDLHDRHTEKERIPMAHTNWSEVTDFFNGVIEEADINAPDTHLEVAIHSPALGKTLEVVIPERIVEDFMKRLPLYEAEVVNEDRSE